MLSVSPENLRSAVVSELDPVKVQHGQENVDIRIFRLELHGVTVELCSLGASIVRLFLPSCQQHSAREDVVLGYGSLEEMWELKNPPYFCVVAGRVANRIKEGQFRLEPNGKEYHLDINNGPNHLHGGLTGFSHRIWQAEVVVDDNENQQPSVRFTLTSPDGDQGYPGSVKVSATYSLQPTPSKNSVKLKLTMEATLLDETPSPINLTNHSYFNLAGHASPEGILGHTLRLYSDAYTPVDDNSIPTREVRSLSEDAVMDWRITRSVKQALADYGGEKMGLTKEQVEADINDRDGSLTVDSYGFDHNYVVRKHRGSGLSLVAVLQHAHRRLTIRSTVPGLQLYTGNFLDGTLPATLKASNEDSKAPAAKYRRWQALCLETQHFPNSILVDRELHPEFAAGQCPILSPESRNYQHDVEYTFEFDILSRDAAPASTEGFYGKDSNETQYASVEEMWEAQDSERWYECAAKYYEENCDSTIDGVLGGFSSITELDLTGSLEFLREIELVRPTATSWTGSSSPAGVAPSGNKRRACECGAGLGRVTKGLLSQLDGIAQFDLVESSATLLSAAPDYLGSDIAAKCRFFCTGLQDWEPAANTYSLIWIQWVLSYLTDDDIVKFLRRCGESLVEDGLIVLKENNCTKSDFDVDLEDASVTRSSRYWRYLIHRAGLRIVHDSLQKGLPKDIYEVPMLALEVCP